MEPILPPPIARPHTRTYALRKPVFEFSRSIPGPEGSIYSLGTRAEIQKLACTAARKSPWLSQNF
jgi:hypothetical protein